MRSAITGAGSRRGRAGSSTAGGSSSSATRTWGAAASQMARRPSAAALACRMRASAGLEPSARGAGSRFGAQVKASSAAVIRSRSSQPISAAVRKRLRASSGMSWKVDRLAALTA